MPYVIHCGPSAAKRGQQFALAVHLCGGGQMQVQHQQRHGHGKDAVAQRRQPVQVAPLNAVVKSGHGQSVILPFLD